jgi:hypothetical protein
MASHLALSGLSSVFNNYINKIKDKNIYNSFVIVNKHLSDIANILKNHQELQLTEEEQEILNSIDLNVYIPASKEPNPLIRGANSLQNKLMDTFYSDTPGPGSDMSPDPMTVNVNKNLMQLKPAGAEGGSSRKKSRKRKHVKRNNNKTRKVKKTRKYKKTIKYKSK